MSDHDTDTLRQEVIGLYVGLMQTLDGASSAAAQSALAMALLMTGERIGLEGPALVDWIEAASLNARAAAVPAERPTARH